MITFHIITLIPEAVKPYLDASILGRAQKAKKIAFKYYNPRDFAKQTGVTGYRRADDRPYGGGPGMVMIAELILHAVELARLKIKNKKSKIKNEIPKVKIIIFNPGGKLFDNKLAKNYSRKYTDLILICGRYEGIDARVKKILKAEEISIGPFVLSGGEVPALVLADAIARQIPGVLGNEASPEENRVSSHEVYTRPAVYEYKNKKYRVPKILTTGNHAEIEKWKKAKPSRQ